MRITSVESTDLFVGTAQRPLQVLRVTLVNDGPGRLTSPDASAEVHVQGPGAASPGPFRITGLGPGQEVTAEVGVQVAAPATPGSSRPVTVTVETASGSARADAELTVADTGWTMWMVSHFHYDPIWWNTQGQFTESRLALPDEDGVVPDVRSAFELVGAHLDKARTDSDYKFVLAEIDYLKPYFDAYPQDRADLRRLMAEGRVEIVGGNYNEPSTNLTSAESTIRNAVYGMGFQRDVFGGDPRTTWMLDVFGHDPGYPGLMAAAGLTSSSWARGPFHQWGPSGVEGGDQRMQFSTEFEWISPDGGGLVTSYMAHHYGAGWRLHRPPDLAGAEREAYGQFRGLSLVATTRNVLLPVGSDHVIPARWVTDIHRDWNQRYVWPRFVTAVPSEFFEAVQAEAGITTSGGSGAAGKAWITPQTRDMNPVYTGKDVSYIDTKQAQRAIEIAVTEAEGLGTAAWLDGGLYPHTALDKAWRLLAYGAHHDGITGVESDQVYLDLAGGWREAWELSSGARLDAARHLAGAATAGADSVTVLNGVARTRDGLARVTVPVSDGGSRGIAVTDEAGVPVPVLAEGARHRADGSLAEVTLTFGARDVPGLGRRTYRLAGLPEPASGWQDVAGTAIENDAYLVTADADHGGTVAVTDKRTGARVLAGPGNELVLQDEYDKHPRHGEGPWHLSPKGPGAGSASVPATVRAQRSPVGSRLVATFRLGDLDVTQETLLWDGADRVEFRTHVDGSIGRDRLLRVRFPADVPGGLPVFQTATAVIGRSFGVVDVDVAEHWWTLDSPAHQWFGLGSAARVRTGDGAGTVQAIGVAEVIGPDDPNELRGKLRELMVALAAAGVTATYSRPDGSRYGAIDADSNLPDVRISVGGPEANSFTAQALAAAGPGYAKVLAGAPGGRLWVPSARSRADAFGPDADVRGTSGLPVLIVAGSSGGGPGELAGAIAALTDDLADAVIEAAADAVPGEAERPVPAALADRSVALLNRGTPGAVVTADGALYMSLMRSCSAWPSQIWIDGDRRTAPDGSSFAWQHWSHTFEYALASGPGDWRTAGFNLTAEDYDHDFITVPGGASAGPGGGLLAVEPATVVVSAVKPRGNPLASGRAGVLAEHLAGAETEITVRLREAAGRPTTARLRLGDGTSPQVTGAHLTDLLEETDGDALAVQDGTVVVALSAFGTVTLVLRLASRIAAGSEMLPRPAEPVQPIHTRYWLHGKGPAPAGNLPVAVHFTPTRVALPAPGDPSAAGSPGAGTLTLTVGAGAEPASGRVELITPGGIVVAPEPDLRYELEPGGYASWDLTVHAAPEVAAGRYFLAARIRDPFGHLVEDTAMVAVGERRWPDPDLPPEETLELMQLDYMASAAEMDLAVLTPALRLDPGSRDEIRVRLTSGLASELHGEAEVVSPYGSWPLLGPRVQGFSLAPGASDVLRFAVSVPAAERPGAKWWALVKVTYFGRVRYSEAIPVEIGPGS